MFSIVVMSTLLLAALGTVGAAARGRAAQRDSALGMSLARQLLAEILQTRYRDLVNPVFGVEAGETRATYDDVDDYDNFSENSASFADGTVVPGGTGWKRKVKVDWVTPADPTAKSTTDQGLKRVVVTVTSPGGKVTALTALRSNDDGYEHTPGSQVTYTCHVGVSVQVGTATAGRNAQGVGLRNLVP
ncbi:MAG: hypothetical protein JWO31_2095 [Phycisphaerales bacterium]|nr:hypothetical protein [Phycisphaerales bacterium]